MAFRFRRSVKVAPGLKLNFGKSGTSVSFGGRGAHATFHSSGKTTTSVGIPGSGVSWVNTSSKGKAGSSRNTTKNTRFSLGGVRFIAKLELPCMILTAAYFILTVAFLWLKMYFWGALCGFVCIVFGTVLFCASKCADSLDEIDTPDGANDDDPFP